MLKKYFFLITFLIVGASNSFGTSFRHSITIEVVSDFKQRPPLKNSTPMIIIIDPSKESPSDSITLQIGEEVVIEVSNPTHQLYNEELNDYNTDDAINCYWTINHWGTYHNYWNNIKPLEVVAMSNRDPLSFQYKAINKGSVTLYLWKGAKITGGD